MMRIAAIDDEAHVLERFERMISDFEDVELCGLFDSGEKLLTYLKTNLLDVIFIDIEMPEVNGLELSQKILDINDNINIVFLTAFNQYAVEAFELQAMDYILKPLSEARLTKTIRRLQKIKTVNNPFIKPFIQCIGDYEIFTKEPLTWKHSKAKEILAFLTHRGGVPVSWEKISDAVWPEYNAQKAQTNFHATMYLLRKRLAEAGISDILESARGNYRLITERVTCDLYQLEKVIKEGKIISREDERLIKVFKKKGYMEASGYSWAHPKAAELEESCKNLE